MRKKEVTTRIKLQIVPQESSDFRDCKWWWVGFSSKGSWNGSMWRGLNISYLSYCILRARRYGEDDTHYFEEEPISIRRSETKGGIASKDRYPSSMGMYWLLVWMEYEKLLLFCFHVSKTQPRPSTHTQENISSAYRNKALSSPYPFSYINSLCISAAPSSFPGRYQKPHFSRIAGTVTVHWACQVWMDGMMLSLICDSIQFLVGGYSFMHLSIHRPFFISKQKSHARMSHRRI